MGQRGSREKEKKKRRRKKNKDRKEDDKAQSEIRIGRTVLPIGSIPPLKSINKIKGNT